MAQRKNFRAAAETWFERFSRFIYQHPCRTIAVLLAVVAMTVAKIGDIQVDTSMEGMFHKEDPALVDYDAFREQFGRDELIIIAVQTEDVFTVPFLKKLKSLHQDLEANVPYLDDIVSLVNARYTFGRNDTLFVGEFLEHFPETPEEMTVLREKALANPFYRNTILSEDGRMTAIVIKPGNYSAEGESGAGVPDFSEVDFSETSSSKANAYLTDRENSRVISAIEEIVHKYNSAGFTVFLAGSPVLTHFLKLSLFRNVIKFMGLAILLVSALMYYLYRSFACVLGMLFIVVISLLSTIGLMAACGVPVKTPTQILPTFLAVVGVCDTVHILAIFFLNLGETGDKAWSIHRAMGHSGLAVVMTSLTTAAGLFSFSTARIAPIADLGIFAGIGVIFAMVYTLAFLPAFAAILPLKPAVGNGRSNHVRLDAVLNKIADVSIKHPFAVIAVFSILGVFSMAGMNRIHFSHDPIHWFDPDAPVRAATEVIDSALKGSVTLEIVIDTQSEDGIMDPGMLTRLEKTVRFLENLKTEDVYVGKVLCITTVIKEINQALNNNRPEHYTVPRNKRLVAQEMLLFENSGSDDLEEFTNTRFSKARVTIRVPVRDAAAYTRFLDLISAHLNETYKSEQVAVTGIVTLLFTAMTHTLHSMMTSYKAAVIVITILMVLLIGRIRIGLLSMIPNLIPIILVVGLMGWQGISMNADTMIVGSIALGLAVDDTVHFMHNFRRYFEKTGKTDDAVRRTLHTVGRAMMATTLLLTLGSFIFMFADLQNIRQFGLLLGITALVALAADFFLAPSILVLANRGRGPEAGSLKSEV